MTRAKDDLTELADQFQKQADRCQEFIGQADCALQSAAIWENAARRVRKKLARAAGKRDPSDPK